jgi:hypothetical protein
MKYRVEVIIIQSYEVIVEADTECAAEELALNTEYSEMRELPGSVEAEVVECIEEPEVDVTPTERHQLAADAGFDTWEDYRGEK